jgi:uncharacterized phage-associated protein
MVNAKKLAELMLAIAEHPGTKELGMTKLWKLVYFVDATALRELGESVTGSEYVKYEHGPVPSRGEKTLKAQQRAGRMSVTLELHARHRMHRVRALDEHDPSVFAEGEWRVIDGVCRSLGKKTAKALSELSHAEPAWIAAVGLGKLDPVLMRYGPEEDAEGL